MRLAGEEMRRLTMKISQVRMYPKPVSAKTRKARVQIENEILTKAKHNSLESLELNMGIIESIVKSTSLRVGCFMTQEYVEANEEDEEEMDQELRREREEKKVDEIAKFENDILIHEENECYNYIVDMEEDMILALVVREVEEDIDRQKERLVFLFKIEEEKERQKADSLTLFQATKQDENDIVG